MLPKIHRLTKKKDFDAVFQKGAGVKRGSLFFRFIKSPLPQSRFGFIVSKKVSPHATVRNLIKRRMRSAVAQSMGAMKISYDVVVTALPGARDTAFQDIVKAVSEALRHYS